MKPNIVFLIILLAVLGTKGQKPIYEQFETIEEFNKHKDYYRKYAIENFNYTKNGISFLYGFKVNITKHEEFKKIDVNISNLLVGRCGVGSQLDYVSATLVSPLIVKGRLIDQKNHLTESRFYKSENIFIVEETLFNDTELNYDTIRTIGNLKTKLKIGDEAILFIEPFKWTTKNIISALIKYSKYSQDRIEEYVRNKYNIEYSKMDSYGLTISSFKIENRTLLDNYGKIGSTKKITNHIKSIIKLNNREDFLNIHK